MFLFFGRCETHVTPSLAPSSVRRASRGYCFFEQGFTSAKPKQLHGSRTSECMPSGLLFLGHNICGYQSFGVLTYSSRLYYHSYTYDDKVLPQDIRTCFVACCIMPTTLLYYNIQQCTSTASVPAMAYNSIHRL